MWTVSARVKARAARPDDLTIHGSPYSTPRAHATPTVETRRLHVLTFRITLSQFRASAFWSRVGPSL